MPIPPLIQMVTAPAAAPGGRESPLIEQATILTVYDNGALTLALDDGLLVLATQCTDEPLQAGMRCWFAATETGAVVYGSV